MITVRFNDLKEFMKELGQWVERNKVADNIVRITAVWRPSKMAPIYYISIMATALVKSDLGPQLIKLEHDVGQVIGRNANDTGSQDTLDRAERFSKELEELLQAARMDVRNGVFETEEA